MNDNHGQHTSDDDSDHYRKTFRVEPGRPLLLKEFDPGYSGKHENKAKAMPEIERLRRSGWTSCSSSFMPNRNARC